MCCVAIYCCMDLWGSTLPTIPCNTSQMTSGHFRCRVDILCKQITKKNMEICTLNVSDLSRKQCIMVNWVQMLDCIYNNWVLPLPRSAIMSQWHVMVLCLHSPGQKAVFFPNLFKSTVVLFLKTHSSQALSYCGLAIKGPSPGVYICIWCKYSCSTLNQNR